MRSIREDRMPGELGWFGVWPKGRGTDGLQLDEIEYLMCKSLAYDAPISLQTSFASMEAHPLTPGILAIVKAYEEVRGARTWVSEATRVRLREPGKDFVFLRGAGVHHLPRPEFVEVEALVGVAGARDLRGLIGRRGDDTVATVWHCAGKVGKLCFHAGARVRAEDIFGRNYQVTRRGEKLEIPLRRERTTLIFSGTPLEAARKLLAGAELGLRPPVTLWLQAEDAARIVGKMAKGSAVGVKEEGAFGDLVVCTGRPNRLKPDEWYCEYRVDIPHEGRWTLWARVRYPSGADHSFGIVLPGQEVTLDHTQVLGNCGVNQKKWHWTGRGGGSTTVPPGQPITFTLPKGPFTFRIHAREGGGTVQMNPRLDCLCLTDDPTYVPTDGGARAALEENE
jgi:hypothetical protein